MTNKQPTRRSFLKTVGLGTLGGALSKPAAARLIPPAAPRELLVYVGTYTDGKSEGIYVYRMNLSSGELTHLHTVKAVNPSFLAIDARGKYLYAVNEVMEFGGAQSGAVSAFSIEQRTGNLRLLNQQPTLGGAPCYVSVGRADRFVLVANYAGGNVSVFPVRPDGRLGASTDLAQHRGSGVNPERQEAAHAHSVVFDHAHRFVFAADLGTDKVMSYRFDTRHGKLRPNTPPWFETRPGAGPRHLAFHPDGRRAYVINELDSTVTAFAYNGRAGTLRELQTVSTLPRGFSGANTCADIHISPSGRFLYGSNRGHDSIVLFEIMRTNGRLRYLEHTPTSGKTPRNFGLDPTGKFLLAANQNSDTILTFRVDAATGRLQRTEHVRRVPSPVCVKFISPVTS